MEEVLFLFVDKLPVGGKPRCTQPYGSAHGIISGRERPGHNFTVIVSYYMHVYRYEHENRN
jgi:hypothetical protein